MDDAPGDELYRLPLAEFTAARNRLAREVAKAGDKAAADDIKRLRKPTVAAWALNQVARHDGRVIEELLAAGQELRDQQQALLRGRRLDLRPARAAVDQAVRTVVDRASDVLNAAGQSMSDATRARAVATLGAAAVDEALGAALRRGILVEDTQLVGFPMGMDEAGNGDEVLAAVDVDDVQEPPRTEVPRAAVRAARQRLESVEADLRRAEAWVERANDRAVRARRRLDDYLAEAREAEGARATAEEQRRAAEAELRELEDGPS